LRKETYKNTPQGDLIKLLPPKDFRVVEERFMDIAPGAREVKIIMELTEKSAAEFGFDIPIQYGYVKLSDFAKETINFKPREVSLHDWGDGSWLLIFEKTKTDETAFFVRIEDVKTFLLGGRRNNMKDYVFSPE
jgi:hypothetical protein